ncbi:uncharacterized protein LOC111376263 [Olea europaea var. sylvestris]|uniref:uncharacterized protein LOC111376263 n=1 Tax=Olea europaea var. sylvestris TaxID=158386 RepID=UPI000C1CDAB4|nr:uncharacterized protein LOC111376263 [Olea europaea var. sylvestris]
MAKQRRIEGQRLRHLSIPSSSISSKAFGHFFPQVIQSFFRHSNPPPAHHRLLQRNLQPKLGVRGETRGNPRNYDIVLSGNKAMQFQWASSCSHANILETSFSDVLKSNSKKPISKGGWHDL